MGYRSEPKESVMKPTSSRRRIVGFRARPFRYVFFFRGPVPRSATTLRRSATGSCFLALVVVTGAQGGDRAPGIVSSVTSFLAFNYFFIPPYDTFAIAPRRPRRGAVRLPRPLGLLILSRDGPRDVAGEVGRGAGARAAHAPGPGPSRGRARTGSRQLRRGRADRWCRACGSATARCLSSRAATHAGLDEILVVNGEPGSVPLAADGPGIERLALNVGGRNLGVLVFEGSRANSR